MTPTTAQTPVPVASTGLRAPLARLADAAAWLTPHSLLALVNRVGIAAIFWMSARTKVDGWFSVSDSAYALFREEYRLPLLPPPLLKTPWVIWQPAKPSSPMHSNILCKSVHLSLAPTPRGNARNWLWEGMTPSFHNASKREKSSTACAWDLLTPSRRLSKYKCN
jgi:hypothetical protein